MNTHHPAKSIIRPAELINVLCGAWFCAALLVAPGIADAAPRKSTAMDSHAEQRQAGPRPECSSAQRGTGEAGGNAEAQGQRGRTASSATVTTGEITCRLAAAAQVSIRNNPGIF